MPDKKMTAEPTLPSHEETSEYFAKKLLEKMVALAKKREMSTVYGFAQCLRNNHPDSIWCALGLYWYFLLIKQVENALVCEQIVLKRFKSLDKEQNKFYQQCFPLQQALKGGLKLPSPTPPSEPGKQAPVVVSTLAIHMLEKSRLSERMEKETDSENKLALGSLEALTKEKSLYQVNPVVFETLERLLDEQPNMRTVIELVRAELQARLLVDAPAKLPPILLCGSPGTGKTRFALEIAKAMGLPFTDISVAGSADAFKILGLSRFWGKSGVGMIAKSFVEHDAANPIFLFDEIDKAGRSEQGSPHDALLGLLEERTAREFKDAFIDVPMNIGHASFIATANTITNIPGPLLSRFVVVNIPELTEDERMQVASSIYTHLCDSEPYGRLFSEGLPESVSSALAKRVGFSPRMAKQLLRQAMQKACTQVTDKPQPKSMTLGTEHLNLASAGKRQMGFVAN